MSALFIGDDGKGFIDSVNFIHSLPYLPVIEILLVGVPIAVHGLYGIDRLRSARYNSFATDGARPSLPLPKNRAFTWQRITSMLLVVGLGLHIYYMRFHNQPKEAEAGFQVELSKDAGLVNVASRLHTKLIAVDEERVIATSDNVGTAFLLVVRDTFKSIPLCFLYSLFVLLAVFHSCNGLWTFSITWGISLSERSRVVIRHVANALMLLLFFLGFAAIWGVYWLNLRY
jgi:succinate dehydrogenase / fumarate reductase cytochrome b subunit